MEIVIATGNQGKLREIRRLLEGTSIVVRGLDEFDGVPEIVEDGLTFRDNARKKAATVARFTGMVTLADDSGLVVDALSGAPGVQSARYAGETATDSQNNAKLMAAMADIGEDARQAAFHCAMALCAPDGECRFFEGRLEGVIIDAMRGEGGFGYDPLFLVREYGKTLAEIPMEAKNRISHRGQALRQAVAFLEANFISD